MRRILIALGLLISFAAVAGAADLDFTPLHRDIPFSFGNPGARSLGMGGAFLGRADDASAAEANPAGLPIIIKRELTVEYRNRQVSSPFPSGLVSVGTSGVTQRFSLFDTKRSEISFASFAMPVGPIVMAAYYQVPLDYRNQQTLNQTVQTPAPCDVPGTPRCFITITRAGTYGINYKSTVQGVALGGKVRRWSLGLAVKRQSVDLQSLRLISDVPRDINNVPIPVQQGTFSGRQSKITYTGGIKWESSNENFTLGAVYKKGANYNISNGSTSQSTVCQPGFACNSPFSVPDQYGIGMSVRWHNFTFNEDVVRVKYSQLLKGFISETLCTELGTNQFCSANINPGFRVNDATEVHFGGEYLIPRTSFAVRAGVWVEPAHGLNFALNRDLLSQGVNAIITQRIQAVGSSIFSDPSRNLTKQTHIAGGIGYNARHFEINAAYDHAERSRTGSLSLLTRF